MLKKDAHGSAPSAPLFLALAVLLGAAPPLVAQRVRVRSTTTARYIELMPIRLDSSGDFAAAGRQSAAPLTQDIELSAWGLGIPGLRAYGLVRFRGSLGNALVWPRSDDHFDALHAFVELERPAWRARIGRQERVSGLGIYTFDGGSALWRPFPAVRVEGFLGRGLARGFLEPLSSDAIRSIDPLRPGQGTLLFGLTARAAPVAGWSTSAAWQKEILADRSGLVSERVALDARGPIGRHFSITGSIDGDLAAEAVGRARLAVAWRMPRGRIEVEAFRYRPVFDLTTIWGVFSPEGHQGAGARIEIPAVRGIVLDGGVVYKRYRPATETTPFLVGVGNYSTAFDAGGHWARNAVAVEARWRLLKGYGGSHSGGDASVSYASPEGRWSAGANLSVFKEVEQFRIATGTVTGLGGRADVRLTPRLFLRGEVERYWHQPTRGDITIDWSQLRAMLAVEWTFGADADRVGAWH